MLLRRWYSPSGATPYVKFSYWNLNSPQLFRLSYVYLVNTLSWVWAPFLAWRRLATIPTSLPFSSSYRILWRSCCTSRSLSPYRCRSNSTRICRRCSRSRTTSTIWPSNIRAPAKFNLSYQLIGALTVDNLFDVVIY